MRRIAIWRHGRTSWNAEHRFQGQSDIELDDEGYRQARRAAAMLASMSPSRIVSSDLKRTRQTAAPLAELTGLPVDSDERLRETYAGKWEGMTRDEIKAQYGEALERWPVDPFMQTGMTGETRLEVALRTAAAIDEAVHTVPPGGLLVVVTHGGAARAAMGQLMGLPPEHWASLGVLTNCAWSVLLENGPPGPPWRLQEYNAGSLPEPIPVDGVWPADDR